MDTGFDLLKKHLAASYPNESRGIEIKGIDLVLLAADTVGCLTTYYGRFGNIKKLDLKRQNILKQCRNELAFVVNELNGYAKECFKELLTIADIVLTELGTK